MNERGSPAGEDLRVESSFPFFDSQTKPRRDGNGKGEQDQRICGRDASGFHKSAEIFNYTFQTQSASLFDSCK